jgi:nicotinamide riboside kinase
MAGRPVKVVVLTGPESSGKSFLAQRLQQRFGGLVVGEYVRHFIERERRDTCLEDIPAIARGQLDWEDAARAREPELLARRYDLHLLLSPLGVEWQGDGQRCQPDLADRLHFHRHCGDWLRQHGQACVDVGGDWAQRERQVLEQVTRLID